MSRSADKNNHKKINRYLNFMGVSFKDVTSHSRPHWDV